MYFSDDVLAMLNREHATLESRYFGLVGKFVHRTYRSKKAQEYATHGFARRMGTLKRCAQNVFRLLPPADPRIPSEENLADAAISLQSFVLNVYGAVDNLAWIWVEEAGLRTSKGSALPKNAIGLTKKCDLVRESLSPDFQTLLKERDNWFENVEGYRHALAHRIPLYVPPHSVHRKDVERYKELGAQAFQAGLRGDTQEQLKLENEQMKLAHFQPVMAHSWEEDSRTVIFHPQLITDFKTVEELGLRLHKELESLPRHRV